MTRVVKFDGAPGTGKTYRLRKKLQAHVNDGLGLSGFYWITFTNSGREDVEPELLELFPDEERGEVTRRAKTFHGLSLSLLTSQGVIHTGSGEDEGDDRIIAPQYEEAVEFYETFCERHGMAFDATETATRQLLSGERSTDKTGNQFFALNDYLAQCCYGPERWRQAPITIRTHGDAVKRLVKEWDRFKRTHTPRLWEHSDYIAEAFERGLSPAVEVLLVDEFQDLAPVEYRLFKLWRDSGSIDVAYIAGDPEQAIYSFRGGKPLYFEETDVYTCITLKESYRCPSAITDVATAILDSHEATDPRGFEGVDDGGTARWRSFKGPGELRREVIEATDRYPDANPSTFLLTRTQYELRRLISDLEDVGIPFELLGRRSSVWSGSLAAMLQFLNNYKSGGSAFLDRNAAAVVAKLPVEGGGEITRKQFGNVIDRGAVAPYLEEYDDVREIVDALQLPRWKRSILRNAVDAPASIGPKEVRVGTIHSAKGLEAPAVYLFADSSETATLRYARDPKHAAEEHRVYYVGATRASNELHLVEGYFSDQVAPPLKYVRARGVASA